MKTSSSPVGIQFQREVLLASNNILLVAPPIYDYRLEWAKWHQPAGLLQIASWLRSQGKDVRLVDCLYSLRKQIPRRKVGSVEVEGYTFNKWHYGLQYNQLKAELQKLLAEPWQPDIVFVTTLNSIWWEAARDTIAEIKKLLPQTRIVLGGLYPTIESEHAVQYSGADQIVIGHVSEASGIAPDISLYPIPPNSTGIYFYRRGTTDESTSAFLPRATQDVIGEIKEKTALGVREFIFFDEQILSKDIGEFTDLLEGIGRLNLNIRFVLPGNISPQVMTKELAQGIKRAGIKQIYLHCDIDFGYDSIQYTASLSDYEKCTDLLLTHGGFKPRDGTLAAMLVVGLPHEDLEKVSERLIRLAGTVGSVMLVPFQYVPGLHKGVMFDRVLAQNGSFSPETFNSKLFPLARLSGKSIEDYIELIRLAALLNSKYRSQSFDFLGENLAAQMFRESIRTEGWNPFRRDTETAEPLEIPLMAR